MSFSRCLLMKQFPHFFCVSSIRPHSIHELLTSFQVSVIFVIVLFIDRQIQDCFHHKHFPKQPLAITNYAACSHHVQRLHSVQMKWKKRRQSDYASILYALANRVSREICFVFKYWINSVGALFLNDLNYRPQIELIWKTCDNFF